MTAQPELTFPSAPIDGEALATVRLVGEDWRADVDWKVFVSACRLIANENGGIVDPNKVRAELTDFYGELTIDPQRYAAFWGLATRKPPKKARKGSADRSPFLDNDGWTINDDTKGKNAGKPIRLRRLRVAS